MTTDVDGMKMRCAFLTNNPKRQLRKKRVRKKVKYKNLFDFHNYWFKKYRHLLQWREMWRREGCLSVMCCKGGDRQVGSTQCLYISSSLCRHFAMRLGKKKPRLKHALPPSIFLSQPCNAVRLELTTIPWTITRLTSSKILFYSLH